MNAESTPFASWSRADWIAAKRELRDFASAVRREHHRGGRFGRGRGFGPRQAGPGFPFGRGFADAGPRAGRGDIRAAILALLAEQPMHGYQIIQELESRSGGAWRPSPGSVYPTLQQLEDEGLVSAKQADAGRRVYELTDSGRNEADAAKSESRPWDEAAGAVDGDVASLRELFFQVAAAAWQVGRAGTRAQVSAAQEILRDARRRLYRLLAEDEPVDS